MMMRSLRCRLGSFGTALGMLVLSMVLTACGGGEVSGTDDAVAGLLDLRAQSPGRIEGSFTRDGATVNFSAVQSGGVTTLLVGTTAGQELARQVVDAGATTLSLLAGRLIYKTPAGQTAPIASGDEAALSALLQVPEARILPWLSQELGAQGISGATHPASFAIHGFAHFVATAANIELPPLSERMSLAADFAAQSKNCKDLRKDPNRDGCYGMCGRGCGCWSWVCGDCCWHKGCANHDTACRNCGISNPKACAACASFSAFFTGGGC